MFCVHSYVHHDGSIGVLCGFKCGTDFTFRTPEFKEFMDNVCMALAVYWKNERPSDNEFQLGFDLINCVHDDISINDYQKQISKIFKEEIWIDPNWRHFEQIQVQRNYIVK